METQRPARLVDPVCGMTVDVDRTEAAGLLLELDGRTYGFCRDGCRRAFADDPRSFLKAGEPSVDDGSVGESVLAADGLPVIDEGIRRWYESCSCCLSEAYPEIKARLDAERAAASARPADAGICEVAEAALPG